MEIVALILSILTLGMVTQNWLLTNKIKKLKEETETNDVEKKLTALSIRQLQIKNDVDRMSLDELVNRKRDGQRNDPQGR